MYYGMEGMDDFMGLGAAKAKTAAQCAKIQAKIDTIKAKQNAGGTVAQMKTWDKQVVNQTKLLDKCLESAGLPASGSEPETGAVAAAAAQQFSSKDLATAAALVGAGKLSPEAEQSLRQAMGLPMSEEATKQAAMSMTSGQPSGGAGSEELIWGIPKGVVYVIGGVLTVGVLMTLLLQNRSKSSAK